MKSIIEAIYIAALERRLTKRCLAMFPEARPVFVRVFTCERCNLPCVRHCASRRETQPDGFMCGACEVQEAKCAGPTKSA